MRIRTSANCKYPKTKSIKINLLRSAQTASIDKLYFSDNKLYSPLAWKKVAKYKNAPSGILSAYYSFGNNALITITKGGVKVYDEAAKKDFADVTFTYSDMPFFVDTVYNGYNTAMAISKDAVLAYNNYIAGTTTLNYKFACGTIHCGRLFAVDYSQSKKIWWATSGVLDWSDDGVRSFGYVNLSPTGGDVNALINFKSKLIAVRNCGITIIDALGEPENFCVEESANYLTCDGIIAATCLPCCGKLYFYTQSGLYYYDGSDIEVAKYVDVCHIKDVQYAAVYGSKYYIYCTKDGVNCVYVYDCLNNFGYFDGINPTCLLPSDDGLLAVCSGGIYTIDEATYALGSWKSSEYNFGKSGVKYLKYMVVSGEGQVTVTVNCDGASRQYSGFGRHNVNMSGRSFSFYITSCGKVDGVKLYAEAASDI